MPGESFGLISLTTLTSLAVMISYADRSIMSSAIIPMAEEFGYDKAEQGIILSSFFIGYAITQVIGGYLSDKFDSKFVISFGFFVWSISTAITPFFAFPNTLIPLMTVRIILGLSEGVLFPGIHSTISHYVNVNHQSTVVSIMTSFSYLGVCTAFFVTPFVVHTYGWPTIYYLMGFLGLIWLPIWSCYDMHRGVFVWKPSLFNNNNNCYHNNTHTHIQTHTYHYPLNTHQPFLNIHKQQLTHSPTHDNTNTHDSYTYKHVIKDVDFEGYEKNVNSFVDDEKDMVIAETPPTSFEEETLNRHTYTHTHTNTHTHTSTPIQPIKLLLILLTKKQIWAIIICQYCNSFGMMGLISWLPSYIQDVFAVKYTKLALYTSLPYFGQTVVAFGAGFFADWMIKRQFTISFVRKSIQISSMLVPATTLFLMVFLNVSELTAASLLFIGCSASALSCAAVSVNQLDILPEYAGFVFGIGNTFGVIAGIVAIPIMGVILEYTSSWFIVFTFFSIHYVVGAIFWLMWASGTEMKI